MSSHLRPHEPSPTELCLCGSGKSFKKCCSGKYSSSGDPYGKYRSQDYHKALLASRRHITWYLLSHRAHTVPVVIAETANSEKMMVMDIRAMSDLIWLLYRCYMKVGKGDLIPAVLSRMSDKIDDPRWSDLIRYFKALWLVDFKRSESEAKKVIARIDVERAVVFDPIALYVNLNQDNLEFKKRIDYNDLIVSLLRHEGLKLHYRVQKGVLFCLIGDIDSGCQLISEAIDLFDALGEDDKSSYGKLTHCHAFQILGEMKKDDYLIQLAIDKFNELLASNVGNEFEDATRSDVYESIGKGFFHLGDFEKSAQNYNKSLGQ